MKLFPCILLLAVALAGCDEALPGCDSTAVKGLVETLFRNTMAKNGAGDAVDLPASHIEMSDVKTLTDSAAAKTCSARTTFVVAPGKGGDPQAAAKIASQWRFTSVGYSVKPGETKGNVVVEILKAE